MAQPMQQISLVAQQLRQGASAYAEQRVFTLLFNQDRQEAAIWMARLADMLDAAEKELASVGEKLARAQVRLPVIIDAEYTEIRA
ncbi:hypothetical protein HK16_10765 [Acetobacter senegalensis]|uniref:Uncharacterized protein n=2 Tax=Acetobacter TaxID=434 RepID=A0A252EIS5_9PROT|nr:MULTISPECIES: hypothetical protein [Acetobacter]ATJ89400.1 hypothetical protein CIW82_00380 [Acetobacter tropicalis]OUL66350.1 hypothetical protein HK16_10765 [Acetobacter senegalensis]